MQANTSEEPVDVRVRRRLRELRAERGLTLQQVADQASIDISTLSRLEAGKRRLALDHLPALAAALGVSADELLGSPPPQDPRVRERPRTHDGITAWPLTRHGPAGGPRAYKINISPERRTPPDVLPVHEGLDWLYVLRGPLRLLLGDQDLTIERGEAVEFSTWTPHWFGAVDGPVELIMIVGPQGARLHLHA
jgi:transcriptional regulator with XRE-family HTH domain